MGANAFHVCYGLRWDIDATDEDSVALLERRSDPRQIAARRHDLDSWWGMTTDEGLCFLLVSKLVGSFGWEGRHSAELGDHEVAGLAGEILPKLRAAGFAAEPSWHFQFEPDR